MKNYQIWKSKYLGLELNLVFFICQNKANDLWYNFIHNYIHMYVLCYNTIKDRQGDK